MKDEIYLMFNDTAIDSLLVGLTRGLGGLAFEQMYSWLYGLLFGNIDLEAYSLWSFCIIGYHQYRSWSNVPDGSSPTPSFSSNASPWYANSVTDCQISRLQIAISSDPLSYLPFAQPFCCPYGVAP
jgi:hypothetical protein